MNQKINEIIEQSGLHIAYENKAVTEKELEFFAQMIVKECIYTLQVKQPRNGKTPENLRSREHVRDLAAKFGISLPMDYNPDMGKWKDDDDHSISPAGIHGDRE